MEIDGRCKFQNHCVARLFAVLSLFGNFRLRATKNANISIFQHGRKMYNRRLYVKSFVAVTHLLKLQFMQTNVAHMSADNYCYVASLSFPHRLGGPATN